MKKSNILYYAYRHAIDKLNGMIANAEKTQALPGQLTRAEVIASPAYQELLAEVEYLWAELGEELQKENGLIDLSKESK